MKAIADPRRASVMLVARLTRRSTIAVAVAAAAFMAFEVMAFNASYPDEAARQMLLLWAQDPGVRIIAGPGSAVNTVGGFAVWDAGVYVILGLGAWILTVTTRVLRGDETVGRSDLLLVGPITAQRLLFTQLTVLLANCLMVAIALTAALALLGTQLTGALLYGAMAFGYCASLVALAAFTSQLFAHRRTALSAAALAFGAMVLIRMIGNSAETRAWLVWLSPAGWLDRSQAFGDNHWWTLIVPAAFVAGLLIVTAIARHLRDTGAGLLTERQAHRSVLAGLGGPTAFAWRSGQGVLVGWALGLAVTAAVIGTLLPTAEDMLSSDTGFLDLLAVAGVSADDISRSFVAMWGTISGAILALYGAFRLGAAREEEAAGRADLLLTRTVSRSRWLTAQLSVLVTGGLVLAAVSATTLYLAAQASGSTLAAGDAWAATINPLPASAAIAAFGVLVYGVAPRLTVPVTAGAAIATYTIALLGPALSWPEWLLTLSPFHHLAQVPVDPVSWSAFAWLTGLAVAFGLAGITAFTRRDVISA